MIDKWMKRNTGERRREKVRERKTEEERIFPLREVLPPSPRNLNLDNSQRNL